MVAVKWLPHPTSLPGMLLCGGKPLLTRGHIAVTLAQCDSDKLSHLETAEPRETSAAHTNRAMQKQDWINNMSDKLVYSNGLLG